MGGLQALIDAVDAPPLSARRSSLHCVGGNPLASRNLRELLAAKANKLLRRRDCPLSAKAGQAYSEDFRMEGRLCPTVFKYFDEALKKIYVQAEQHTDQRA